MLKEVYKGPLPGERGGVALDLVLLSSLQCPSLRMWLSEQLCWCLAKVVDDGLNLTTLLLILNALQINIV